MRLHLGVAPIDLTVTLSKDADFVSTIVRDDSTDWDSSDALTLEFLCRSTSVQWSAVLSGSAAAWDISDTDVNSMISKSPREVRLIYTKDSVRILWATGIVEVV